ncbi:MULTISPECIES: myo-inosose-2 dehydratase [Selenomonas]|uniref:Inosose dehydratase n=1 Tax=Selenomonas ruminis TaxID=2593411 RepID=A0A5D6W2C8_9FIRM|nr:MULTISPECIES: myo-inosose-2 dehydratase [unclassified Selenomonas]MBQ1867191.1 myo-inosose-2 dehydratase [Selenomonas sp.]TYZ20924.1 myo-inosose-2 dehydratase [Selenomonas sp. mPRGC5]
MATIKLGIAPIAWTNDDMPDLGKENTFEQCVSEMALAGFTGCEVGGRYPRDTAVLKKALALRGMEIASAWFSSFLLTQPYEQVEKDFIAHCSFLKSMGAKFCNVAEQGNSVQGKLDVPVFAGKPENTAEQWKLLTEGLDKLGKVAKDMGMTMTYHHHMGTGVQTEAEIDRLMENTNPDYVWLLYDTGHLVCSGEDYLGILKKYMSRIRHIHLKDVRMDVRQRVIDEKMSFLDGVRAGMFTVPGDGDVDFEPIFDYVNKSDFDGWYIVEAEQDPAKANPLEYAQKARKYIREKAGL